MARMNARIRSYADALAYLGGEKTGSQKLGHNTWVEGFGDEMSIVYHHTRVVTYHRDGRVTLDSGGWRTITTLDRLNRCSPFRVYSEGNGDWAVVGTGDSARFEDGMTSDPDGHGWQDHKARVFAGSVR